MRDALLRCELLVRTISASMKADVIASPPQAAREKASRIASDDDGKSDAAAERFAEPIGHHALQHEQRRQDQERAEHVRVLEGAAGAVVERQQIAAAGNQVEVAGDAGERGDHGADDQAAAQHVEPRLRVLRHHHGEEDDGDRHVPGGRDPVRHVRPVHDGDGG